MAPLESLRSSGMILTVKRPRTRLVPRLRLIGNGFLEMVRLFFPVNCSPRWVFPFGGLVSFPPGPMETAALFSRSLATFGSRPSQ